MLSVTRTECSSVTLMSFYAVALRLLAYLLRCSKATCCGSIATVAKQSSECRWSWTGKTTAYARWAFPFGLHISRDKLVNPSVDTHTLEHCSVQPMYVDERERERRFYKFCPPRLAVHLRPGRSPGRFNQPTQNTMLKTGRDNQSSESSFNLHRRRSLNGPVNCTKARNGTCKTGLGTQSSQNKYVDAALGSGCSDMLVSDIHHCDTNPGWSTEADRVAEAC